MKRIDITGQRYGRLTVIKEVEQKGYTRRFLCKCDCGNKKEVAMNQLRTGKTKSCGCLNKERVKESNKKDLTGKRFGKLVVISYVSKTDDHKSIYRCKCDCGKTVDVISTYLTTGDTKSCGCGRIQAGNNLTKYHADNSYNDGVFTPILKSKTRKDSKTGVKGVTLNKKNGKYRASLTIKGKQIYLGEYPTIKEAARARKKGEVKYHKPYLESDDE